MRNESYIAQGNLLLNGLGLATAIKKQLTDEYLSRETTRRFLSDQELMAQIIQEYVPVLLTSFMEKYPNIFPAEIKELVAEPTR